MAEIRRRTFEAREHPKGSAERARLNGHPVTSEYLPSYRYALVTSASGWPLGKPFQTFTTKAAAEAALPDAQRFDEEA